MNRNMQWLAGIGLLVLMGCSGPSAILQERHAVDPVMDMLHRGILDLEENVEELHERIAELQQLPPAGSRGSGVARTRSRGLAASPATVAATA